MTLGNVNAFISPEQLNPEKIYGEHENALFICYNKQYMQGSFACWIVCVKDGFLDHKGCGQKRWPLWTLRSVRINQDAANPPATSRTQRGKRRVVQLSWDKRLRSPVNITGNLHEDKGRKRVGQGRIKRIPFAGQGSDS
jgi:hypothetical protein